MSRILRIFPVLFSAFTCFGQGEVIFNNNTATKISNVVTMAAAPTGTVVGLYIGTPGSLETELSLITTTNMFAPGLFFGGTRRLPGWGGGPVALQVRAWTEGYHSYEEAVDAQVPVGNSIVMNGYLEIPPGPPPTLILLGLNQFNLGMAPIIAPEPSNMMLAVTGFAVFTIYFWRMRQPTDSNQKHSLPVNRS